IFKQVCEIIIENRKSRLQNSYPSKHSKKSLQVIQEVLGFSWKIYQHKEASIKQNSPSTFYPGVSQGRQLSPPRSLVGTKRTELFMRRGSKKAALEFS
ncbi:unnamed protein product, partial [Bubo scandiacus]